ncbi:outer dense fiber protein 3-like protein 1 [Gymnodraco acuticeps]|uniref:Outer dense fiber protein 3-like protein 1 n=1 Tax=Gymnodraco acuticeps TaxID=8218 RepID=A0A6P8SPG0_GYMAC|nr:outer dense fiber protein 3-like protein 1 [Gymnodraco acuticeps]
MEARLCGCRFKISSTDSHQVCSSCLGLEHARKAIDAPGSCGHCARFTTKSLRRRLARQASLSGQDPFMPVDLPAGNQGMVATTVGVEPCAVSSWGSTAAAAAGMEPRAVTSWGSQLDLTVVPPVEDVLELDYMEEDEEDTSKFLLSDSDEDDIFVPSAQAAKPEAVSAPPGESAPTSPRLSMDLQAYYYSHCCPCFLYKGASKHDPTKKTAPQCTFGSRHETKTEIPPGPSYLIPSNITRVRPPAYSLYSRPKDPKLFQTPGPATYSPENAGKSVFHCAPAYSMSGRGKEISNIQTPGPASYSLPPLLGNNTVVKSTAPSFSLCGRNKHGNFYEDLSKTPGPAAYNVVDPNIYMKRFPQISMTGRNFSPGVSTKTPGPGAYYPEMVTCTRSKAGKSVFHCAPAYSMSGRGKEISNIQTPGMYLVSTSFKLWVTSISGGVWRSG